MKKVRNLLLLITIFLVLITISCSENFQNDELTYISFSTSNRDLDQNYILPNTSDLYWYYGAEKVDSYGFSGQTGTDAPLNFDSTIHNPGIGGSIGPFSQGKWEFTLKGYKEVVEENNNVTTMTLVYTGTSNATLKGTGTTSIPISLTMADGNGTLSFKTNIENISNVEIFVPGTNSTTSLTKNSDGIYSVSLQNGYYENVVIKVYTNDSLSHEESINFRIYSHCITEISGNVDAVVQARTLTIMDSVNSSNTKIYYYLPTGRGRALVLG